MIDVTHEISAVTRSIGTRILDAGEARVMTIARTYDTDIDDVWDAVTSAERLPRWFLPVTGDLQVGGRYALEGNASGTIERCDPPRSFAATWEFAGAVSWIEVRLTAVDDTHTRFELEHVAHVDDHWTQYGPGAVGVGWESGLVGLARHLAGSDLDAAAFEAWCATDDGRAYLTRSSEAWGEASIAAGTDPEAARAAAARTTAFYTAAPA